MEIKTRKNGHKLGKPSLTGQAMSYASDFGAEKDKNKISHSSFFPRYNLL
jgi:hypothetical protein